MVSAFGKASDSLVMSESIAVTWKGTGAYHSEESGRFIFTAELPEGYILAKDVKLPKIYVFVGKQGRMMPLADTGYSFDPDTGTLTVTSNEGTCAWREDSSIVGVDEDGKEDYSKVKSVICTADVSETQERAFFNCKKLTFVSMPNVTKLGDQTFAYCGFESIDLPKLTYIGSESVSNCYNLKSVSFPMVTEVANNAFNGCTGLETVSLPELTTAGGYIFISCGKLKEISLPKLTTLDEWAFRG